MRVMARSSQAACQAFFTVRRPGRAPTRRSTALRLTRMARTGSRSKGWMGFRAWAAGSTPPAAPGPAASVGESTGLATLMCTSGNDAIRMGWNQAFPWTGCRPFLDAGPGLSTGGADAEAGPRARRFNNS